MNRIERRQILKAVRGMTAEDAMKHVVIHMYYNRTEPLTSYERSVALELADIHCKGDLYHGTQMSFGVGSRLLAPKLTGNDPRGLGNHLPFRSEFVFVTPNLEYASGFSGDQGSIYIVQPHGPVMASPNVVRAYLALRKTEHFMSGEFSLCFGREFCCESATIIGVAS